MKRSTIFQASMSEPASEEDWMSWSIEQKDKMIRHQANIIGVLLLIIAIIVIRSS